MRRLLCLSACCLALAFTVGCVTEIPQVRIEDISFVQKNYPQENEPNSLAFAYAEPELVVEADLSAELINGLQERLRYNSDSIACHLNNELDKIILSKGFTITARFRSIRYMTFTEKRNTSALFYPEIKIRIKEKSDIEETSGGKFSTAGILEIEADVNIIMLEPMSNEIIWIKSIPVKEITDSFQYRNAFWGGSTGTTLIRNIAKYKVSRGQKYTVPENLLEIGKQIDGIYEEIQRKIIDATVRFVDAEEFSFLNTDIKKLKTIKRY